MNTSLSLRGRVADQFIWSNRSTLMMSTQDSDEPTCPEPAR
jgi:hypothetical protein